METSNYKVPVEKNSASGTYSIKLPKEFYEKESIMQALHEYSNKFRSTMEPIEERHVLVLLIPKEEQENENLDLTAKDFINVVMDFQIKRDLEREYSHIRDRIVDYAYSAVKKK